MESRTQLKTVKITLNIFAVCLKVRQLQFFHLIKVVTHRFDGTFSDLINMIILNSNAPAERANVWANFGAKIQIIFQLFLKFREMETFKYVT